MATNRKIAALGVLSLIMTVMIALALTGRPQGDAAAEKDTGVQAMTADGAPAEGEVPPDGPADIKKQYVLKDFFGYIGIFEPEDMEDPKMVTGINISKLRIADARMLEDGITVNGEDELARLLEDFGS